MRREGRHAGYCERQLSLKEILKNSESYTKLMKLINREGSMHKKEIRRDTQRTRQPEWERRMNQSKIHGFVCSLFFRQTKTLPLLNVSI